MAIEFQTHALPTCQPALQNAGAERVGAVFTVMNHARLSCLACCAEWAAVADRHSDPARIKALAKRAFSL